MATSDLDPATALEALEALDEVIARQRFKVRELALRIEPDLTDEDLQHLHDFPRVCDDPVFRIEDGQLAALTRARIALQSRLLGLTSHA